MNRGTTYSLRYRGRGGLNLRARGRGLRGSSAARSVNSPPYAAFGQAMQFITSIKLQELEKQRLACEAHSAVIAAANAAGDELSRAEILRDGAKKDPSFHSDVLRGWGAHIKHSLRRFDCATLFGNLFNEWLSSGDSVTAYATANEERLGSNDSFVEIGRKELHDQRNRLDSIIFSSAAVDTDALLEYLTSLFTDDGPA